MIIESGRKDLLLECQDRISMISDVQTLERLGEFLSVEEPGKTYPTTIKNSGITFSYEQLNVMFKSVFDKYGYTYMLHNFLKWTFTSEQLETFIKDNKEFFVKYIEKVKDNKIDKIDGSDAFTELVLETNSIELIDSAEKYSVSNLKLLAKTVKENKKIRMTSYKTEMIKRLFEVKESLDNAEFFLFLGVLKEQDYHRTIDREFTSLINDNIEYLIDAATKLGDIPICLSISETFRDECIKRNRIDLAIKCLLPKEILENEELAKVYCKELNIDYKDFDKKIKWLSKYYEINKDLFNVFLPTSLKDNIFNFNHEHFERFINDIDMQKSLAKLDDFELKAVSKILELYDYKDYDVTYMIYNVINNITDYKELIGNLDIDVLKEDDLRKLVAILQFKDNPYKINDLEKLHNYKDIRKNYFESNFKTSELEENKDNLLKSIFNIDLEEAQFIFNQYCHDEENMQLLENSELPSSVYNKLKLIKGILEADNPEVLFSIYGRIKNVKVHDNEIPFEAYLRSVYTDLYSESLYRIEERNNIYDPKDNVSDTIQYNGKNINVCIPKGNFNFMIHCIGACSNPEDITSSNYRDDWFDRPQILDHFLACSYINEKKIFSLINQNKVVLGYDTLNGGDILAMCRSDVDSISFPAKQYIGGKLFRMQNGTKPKMFVPSLLVKNLDDSRYNEVVFERRNNDVIGRKELKKGPDYIIMMVDSWKKENMLCLKDLYENELSFINEEDKQEILKFSYSNQINNLLAKKYKDIVINNAKEQGIPAKEMADKYISLILNAKLYENNLKAASEFDVPLVVVDRQACFEKILNSLKGYDDSAKEELLQEYLKEDCAGKKELFNKVLKLADEGDLPVGQKKESVSR